MWDFWRKKIQIGFVSYCTIRRTLCWTCFDLDLTLYHCRWYGGLGLPCVIFLSVVFYYLGILFGLCGQRPGHDAPCCNRGTGSNFIVGFVLYWLGHSTFKEEIVLRFFTNCTCTCSCSSKSEYESTAFTYKIMNKSTCIFISLKKPLFLKFKCARD